MGNLVGEVVLPLEPQDVGGRSDVLFVVDERLHSGSDGLEVVHRLSDVVVGFELDSGYVFISCSEDALKTNKF